jgi:ceramide glucosyltransferase
MIHKIFQAVAILGCVSSSIYYMLCLWSASVFLRERQAKPQALPTETPAISILKPLKDVDPGIYESLRSHCLQDYPECEIIFGVSDAADPAVTSVQQLQREFPRRRIQLVVCPDILGANIKVSNLSVMVESATHDLLVVNDSDIRVERDYLSRIAEPFSDERVGIVTCLYRGIAAPSLGSRLESLGISTDFSPGVLVARSIEGGIRFGLGSTLAFRRRDLERIGGFASIVDFLADDYELGKRIADLGLQVHLSDVVVETHLPHYDLRGFLDHQIRWARGVRDSRMGGYIGLVSTFGLMWALMAVIAFYGVSWAWLLLCAVGALRLAVAITIGKAVLQDSKVIKLLWLIPLRDLIAVGVWIASFAGHTVTWRGDRFELRKGRLIRVETPNG